VNVVEELKGLVLVAPNELIDSLGKVLRLHDELVSVLALKAMELARSPGLAASFERVSVQLVAELVGNHAIIVSMHYHHGRSKLGNVLIRLEPKAIIVNWLQNCRLEPWQMSKELSKMLRGRKNIYQN
jgi:hypothetical protein